MFQAVAAGIPIRIKNAAFPERQGTLIHPASSASGPRATSRHATAVSVKPGMTVLNVCSNRRSASHGFLARIFARLDERDIVADLISISEVHVSMVVAGDVSAAFVRLVCVRPCPCVYV